MGALQAAKYYLKNKIFLSQRCLKLLPTASSKFCVHELDKLDKHLIKIELGVRPKMYSKSEIICRN